MSGFKSKFLTLLLLLVSVLAFGQRGSIINPATPAVNPLDPDGDDWVTLSGAVFSNDGWYVDEFERKMFGIPKVGNGDVAGDNGSGPACGITDAIPDSSGYSVYAFFDHLSIDKNLIFRFRVGDDNSSVEAYSILLDTDQKFGNPSDPSVTSPDPNWTPDNPGFEIDITLIKRHNAGVFVYNIDGNESCPNTELATYDFDTHFQISIGDEVTCGDPDYFYDYYVPFAEIITQYNISNNTIPGSIDISESTPFRYVAVTNISATCAMEGNISDVSGVDNTDPLYDGQDGIIQSFFDIIESQCGSPVADLVDGGPGFDKEKVTKPSIDQPIVEGQTYISGTTVESNIWVVLSIYHNIGTLQSPSWSSTPDFTAGMGTTGTTWRFNFASALLPYDSIVARTQLTQNSVPCGSGGNNTSSTSVTIVLPNDKPVANPQNLSTPEDTPLNIVLTGSDPDGNSITFSIAPGTGPTHGSITGSGTNWTYTPFADYFGPDSFSFTVTEQTNAVLDSTNVITITVTPVNDPPVVTGTAGSVAYTSVQSSIIIDNGINVTDVDDINIESATVSITGNFVTGQDVLIFTNTANITGSYNSTTGVLTLTGTATKAQYAAALATVRYGNSSTQPNTATRTVSFVANDGNANSAPFTRNITFTIDNFPPHIVDNNGRLDYQTNEDVQLTNQCLTVTDPEGQSVSITSVTSLTNHGTTVPTGLCFTYTPTANFNGEEQVRIIVCDNGVPSKCDTVLVVITVVPVNDPPVAVNDAASTNEDTPVTFNILTNDSDIDNAIDPASVILTPTTVAGQGTFVYNGAGSVTFTPVADFTGVVTINYTVKDVSAAVSNSATITVTVNGINDAPVANDDSFTTPEDTGLTNNVLTNDSDVDLNALSVTQFIVAGDITVYASGSTASVAGIGTIVINANGSFTFTPALNYNNASPVLVATYTISDGQGGTDTATLSIRVTPVNDNPVGGNDTGTSNAFFSTPENTPITLADNANVLDNDTDPDGDVLSVTQFVVNATTFTISAGSSNSAVLAEGTVKIYSNGDLEYTPTTDYNGTLPLITYTVSDGNGGTASATIVIVVTPVNSAPVATDDSYTTQEDVVLNVGNVLSNDTDVEGNALSVASFVVPGDGTTYAAGNTATVTGIGTIRLNADGSFVFTPALNYNNASPVLVATYTVSDGLGGTDQATVSIRVTPVNDNPVGGDDTGADAFTTLEDTPITLADNANVLDNDTDPEGDVLSVTQFVINSVTYTISAGSSNSAVLAGTGTVTLHSNGDLEFTPVLNFNGNVSLITYTTSDGNGGSATATARIVVTPVNDLPVAVDDNYTMLQDDVLSDNVVLNDTDVDGNTLTVTQFVVTGDATNYSAGNTAPIAGVGSIVINANGTFTFTPLAGYNGIVPNVTYTISDGNGGTDNAVVSITVVTVINYPIAANDNYSTAEDITLNGVNVLDNDQLAGTLSVTQFTVAGDATTYSAGSTAAISGIGSVQINSNGSLTFIPALNYNGGVPVITYTNTDGSGTATATVSIVVTPVNDNPVGGNDTGADAFTTLEDTPITLADNANVLDNDTDPEGDVLSVTQFVVSSVTYPISSGSSSSAVLAGIGTVTIHSNGDLEFTPALNFNGTVPLITYTNSDGNGGTATATASIIVTPVNDTPVGGNDTGADAFTTPEDDPITLAENANVLDNDIDPEGDVMSVTQFIVNGVTHAVASGGSGSATLAGIGTIILHSNGALEFTPVQDYTGTVPIITYTVTDGSGTATATASIVVTPLNDPPVAVTDDTFTTQEDVVLNVGNVLTNDTDADGNSLVVATFVVPGDVTVYAAGTTATVTGIGTIKLNADGSFTFTPALNYNNASPVLVSTYTVSDGNGGTDDATVSIRVTPVNDTPVGGNDTGADAFTTVEDDPITLAENANVLDNDIDPEGDAMSVTQFVVNGVTYAVAPGGSGSATLAGIGTIILHSNGALEFTSVQDYNGTVPIITYTVTDGSGTATATASIIVTPFNDSPVAVNDATFVTPEDTNLNNNVVSNDIDIDGDVLTVVQFTVPGDATIYPAGTTASIPGIGTIVINADGTFVFSPALDYNNDSPVLVATYTVSDGNGGTDDATVSIRVTPVNDNPNGQDDNGTGVDADAFTTPEDTPITLADNANVLTNDIDPDGDVLTVTQFIFDGVTHLITAGSSNSGTMAGVGSVTIYSNGNLTFIPELDYNGTVPDVTYTISDGNGGIVSAIARIIVTPVNDPPVKSGGGDINLSTLEDTPVSFCMDLVDSEGNAINVGGGAIVQISDEGSTLVLASITPGAGSTQICFDFTPEPNFNSGPASDDLSVWAIQICDDQNPQACVTVPVRIRVDQVNDLPVTQDDATTTDEDVPVTLNILQNDSDVDTAIDPANKIDPLSIDLDPSTVAEDKTVTVNGQGTFTVADNLGNVTCAPYTNFEGPTVVISYTVKDFSGGLSNASAITVNINALNDAPVLTFIPDKVMNEDTINIRIADRRICPFAEDESTDITYYAPRNTGDNTYTMPQDTSPDYPNCYLFAPQPNYNGETFWEAIACDPQGLCDTVAFKVTLLPINDKPVALDDQLEVPGNVTTNIMSSFVLSNDAPLELIEPYNYTEFNDIYSKKKNGEDSVDVLSVVTIVTPPQFGTAYLMANADTIQYTPNSEFIGSDSFQYKVCDSGLISLCDTATVFITITFPTFKIYEGVSPNGDGSNDYWRIDGIEQYENNEVRVFDRYNNLVYETSDYDNDSNNWRGQATRGLGGTNLPEGTYYYTVYLGNGRATYSGFVILKRN